MSANEEIIIRAVLAGTREYLAESQRVVGANEEIAASTEATGRAMERTTRRGYLMNQALFTVRRLMYGVTLGLIGSGIAAVKWGFDFNSAMQQARVALMPLQSATFNVNKELDYLFRFTKYTPFQFKDVTTSFRLLYGSLSLIGVSADTVNKTLKSVVDSLSFAGKTTPGQLNRVSTALQHMAFMGHVTGQIINQLNRDGLPATAVLKKEFGLTGEEIHNVGRLGIPTLEFLKRFNHFVETTPGYMNAAERQAIHSFHGLFTTFKDNTSQIMGYVEKGFFTHMQMRLKDANAWFDRITKIAQASKGNVNAIMGAIGGAGAVMLWKQLSGAVHNFWLDMSAVIHALTTSRAVWATVYLTLFALNSVLKILNPLLNNMSGLLYILIPLWVTYRVMVIYATVAQNLANLSFAAGITLTKDMTFAQWLLTWARRSGIAAAVWELLLLPRLNIAYAIMRLRLLAVAAAEWLFTTAIIAGYTAEGIMTGATAILSGALLALRVAAAEATAALALGWLAALGPIALVAGAIAGLIALFVILDRKWAAFHDVASGNWIRRQLGISEGAGGGGKYAGGGILGNWLSSKGAPGWLTGAHRVPGMADGGTVLGAGLSWVGERGPELLSLPVGATVIPRQQALSGVSESWRNSGVRERQPIKVMIGRRVLVDIVAEEVATQLARS